MALRILFMSAAVGGRGGIESVTTLVIRELRERGHHVELHLFGPSRNSRWEETLAGAYVGPQSKHTRVTCRWLHILWWTFGMVRKFRPDVIIAMTPSAIILSKLVKLLSGGRYKTWSWLHEAISQLQHTRRLGWADAHLAISSGVGKDIAKAIGRYDNVFVVYNPVVDAPVQSRPGPKDACHFVYIGRLDNEIKRVEDILRALSCIREPWKLSIVGDGEDRRFLSTMAKQLHIENRVRWIGWLDDPWGSVGPVTALVLASISEGFGVVLAEALVRGVPIVSSDCDHGPRDIVLPNSNGWLYPPGNVTALQDILFHIVHEPGILPDPGAVKASGVRFHLPRVVDRMLEAFGALTRDNGTRITKSASGDMVI